MTHAELVSLGAIIFPGIGLGVLANAIGLLAMRHFSLPRALAPEAAESDLSIADLANRRTLATDQPTGTSQTHLAASLSC